MDTLLTIIAILGLGALLIAAVIFVAAARRYVSGESQHLESEALRSDLSPYRRNWAQRSHRDRAAFELLYGPGYPLGEGHSPLADADEDQVFHALVPLDYLMRDPHDRPPELLLVHDYRFMDSSQIQALVPAIPYGQAEHAYKSLQTINPPLYIGL